MLRATVSNPDATEGDLLGDEAYIQLITPEGERVKNPAFDPAVSDIDSERLADLYEDMVVIRRIDTEATALQRQGQLALWPPLLGQEASQIGSVRALNDDDYVVPSYRENGVAFIRGVSGEDLVRTWKGYSHGSWDPALHNMAIPNVIIGAQTLHAVGYAMGIQKDGAKSAAIAYFGDGATSQGDTNEALVFAAAYNAPVIFFCQNNHWAISEPVGLQAQRHIADRSPGFGVPSLRVDGNDVLAVLAATRVALDRAYNDGGPTFIEAVTYRMGPHTTSDDPTKYRKADEVAEWKTKDPISRVEKYLESQGAFTKKLQERVKARADEVAADLRAKCINMPKPSALSMFENIQVDENPILERQRAQYAAYLDLFEGEE